ncbi:MAG: hypothetical protein PHG16_05240 [Lachnospiraceae bacterium]|nr:hypothetical protein [Lachnospiraceae bacterium]
MGYILCKVERATIPYYIENISTNIYSIEELCYYMYNNIYLLDETIINEALCTWLRDELKLRRLAQRLYVLLEEQKTMGDFILPIFKEINYLTFMEFKEMNGRLKIFEEQPEVSRLKMKGDYLYQHEKYINAIRVYTETLEKVKDSGMGNQFTGSVFNNMGCSYAKLFQMEEAYECFEQANQILHTKNSLQSYLFAIYLNKGVDAYERAAEEEKVDEETKRDMDTQIRKSQDVVIPSELDPMLDLWTKNYHRNTGL